MNTHNKHIRKYIFFLYLAFVSLGLISCEDEKVGQQSEYELVIPSNACSFTVNAVDNEDGTIIIYAEPSFTKNFDILGCTVNKVIYYIDNEYISTETSYPFKLEYKSTSIRNGGHILKAVYTVGGERFRETIATRHKEFRVGNNSSFHSPIQFKFDYDRYVRVGDKIHISLNMVDKYNVGYQIKEVKYHFDNKLVSTKTNAPYNFDYSPILVVGLQYPLEVDISYSLDGTTAYYKLSTSISVLADDETLYLYIADYGGNDTKFYTDDVISGTGVLYRGIGDDCVYELNLYWDDKLVGTSQTFPYKFNYPLNNETIGTHKLKREWKTYTKNGYSSSSQTETITIDN